MPIISERLSPVQILWGNRVTAVALSLAIAFERPEPGRMAGVPVFAAIEIGKLFWRRRHAP